MYRNRNGKTVEYKKMPRLKKIDNDFDVSELDEEDSIDEVTEYPEEFF